MSSDTLTTITNLINSPPGQLVAGGVLAGIVWTFFERVEAVLNDNTKLEIAVWLVDVKTAAKVQGWPETFAKVFDRVFGKKHLSMECFVSSCLATISTYILTILLLMSFGKGIHWSLIKGVLPLALVSVFPDYVSLLKTRRFVGYLEHHKSMPITMLVLGADFILGCILAASSALILILVLTVLFGTTLMPLVPPETKTAVADKLALIIAIVGLFGAVPNFLSSLFTSIWLWLYAGSGFLLRIARKFDVGFQWFSRRFDIEKKPLQSIGLVAGALVAVIYWAGLIVAHFV